MEKNNVNWRETHYEVVTFISTCLLVDLDSNDDTTINDTVARHGSGGLYDLSEAWTNEFEKMQAGRVWDGEWLEELHAFCRGKNTPPARHDIAAALTVRLGEALKQIEVLQAWKDSAMKVTGPFFDYMHSREDLTVGDSTVEAAIRLIKERDALVTFAKERKG